MARLEILTRAFNRLEYTVLCVRSIQANAGYVDYRHVIVDQASTDGTGAWLRSVAVEGFYRLLPVWNTTNTGDAGGMADGLARIGADCEYVCQFDNDCALETPGGLERLVTLMDGHPDIGAVMLKRNGVSNVLVPVKVETVDGLELGMLPWGRNYTCCTVMRRALVDLYAPGYTGERIQWVQRVTRRMREERHGVYKALGVCVWHIDGTRGQVARYGRYFAAKTKEASNFTAVDYGKAEP